MATERMYKYLRNLTHSHVSIEAKHCGTGGLLLQFSGAVALHMWWGKRGTPGEPQEKVVVLFFKRQETDKIMLPSTDNMLRAYIC